MPFNYLEWEHQDARGIRGGNNKYMTQALFYDKMWKEDLAHYVLGEETYTLPSGKELPSAYQIVLHSSSEYEAMRKLVGSSEQWETLKSLGWFKTWLDATLADQEARIAADMRNILLELALDGDRQAAKTLLDLTTKKPVGRPKKEKDNKRPADEVDDDMSRVVNFR